MFPTVQVSGGCSRLELHQAIGQHDLAVLTLTTGVGGPAGAQQTGAPVTFSLSGRQWVGYVHTAEPRQDGAGSTLEVSCLGASYVLSGSNQRSWSSASGSMIVQQVCQADSLAADVVPTPRTYEQISQSGMTDWELINRLGDENGRYVITDGVVIRFLDKTALLRGFDPSDPLTLNYAANNSGSIRSYQVISSDDSGVGARHASLSYSGVDPRTGRLLQQVQVGNDITFGASTGTRIFPGVQSTVPVNSSAEAVHRQEAASSTSGWRYRVSVRAVGDVRLVPGAMVAVTGLGSYNAYWVVESAAHVIDTDSHTVDLELVADSLGEPTPAYRNPLVPARPTSTALLRSAADPGLSPAQGFAQGAVRWRAVNALPSIPRPSSPTPSVRRATYRAV